MLLIAVVMLFGRICAYRISADWIWRLGILVDTTIFLFGPLLYMYVRRLLYLEKQPFSLKWPHYILAAGSLSYYIWTLSFPLTTFNQMYASGELNLMFFIVEVAGLLSLVCYWIKTFLLVRGYQKQEALELSYHQSIYTFLKVLLGTVLLFLGLWGLSFISAYFFRIGIPYISYETMWVSMPVFMYCVGYFSLRQPEIFRIPILAKTKQEKDRLKPEEIQKLQKRLHYFIVEEQVFLQSNLTLKMLAEKLNTSSNNLSWLLNQVYQTTFYDYINGHRIQEFIRKIENQEHQQHTILAIAIDVGFNSKTTFNKVFKNSMGVTPSDYIKKSKVA